jgi:phosphonate transport system permease protein
MSASTNRPRFLLAALVSLVVPGAGQFLLGKRQRGIAIFLITLVLAFLINWALLNFKVGAIQAGGQTTSWLWSLLVLYWLWNVADALRLAGGHTGYATLGFIIAALIIYLIGWQVTDANLDRLITRFDDARKVFDSLIHPDLMQHDTVQQIGRVHYWVPCTNPPQPLPGSAPPYKLSIETSCGLVGDVVTMHGEGFLPNSSGNLYWVEVNGTNQTQVREGGQAVVVTTDGNGKFKATFHVPTFAGRGGSDPNNPLEQGIEARFTQEVGPPKPSENFGDLIFKIKDGQFVPGTLFETIALGLMATIFSVIFAMPLSFFAAHNIMARVPGGTAIYYAMRTFLNIVRAIDTVIWGLIVIVWVGLGPFAGMIALTIHSMAALAKLYSEEIEHIDLGPIEAVTASGATLLQVVRYAVIPQIIPPFLAYSLLRWDINMRSATVVGFVAGGGIGFFVLETIRKGGYEQYAAALWAVVVVISAVDIISSKWRERILSGDTKPTITKPAPFFRSPRKLFYALLGLLVFVASWNLTQIDIRKLLDPGPTFGKLLTDFLSLDLTPALLDAVIKQLLLTVFQALIATTLGGLLAIPFSFLAAHNLTGRSRVSVWIYYLTRGVFNVLRSIEALLYVAIFVFWVGIGPFAGTLALAVTTFALIGKLFSEAIENIEVGPLEAVTASGATRLQMIVYAVLPQIVPPFVSYSIYQWDINVRISTIIGFAGGGGIGLLLSTYFGQLQYHKAGTVVALIVIVVAAMDFASAKIRERWV